MHAETGRVRADRAGDGAAGHGPTAPARARRRRGPGGRAGRAGRGQHRRARRGPAFPPGLVERAGTSATGPPRRTSPTSPPWAPRRPRCSSRCAPRPTWTRPGPRSSPTGWPPRRAGRGGRGRRRHVRQPDPDHRGDRAGRPGGPRAGAPRRRAARATSWRMAGRIGLRRGRLHGAVPRLPLTEAAGRGVPAAGRAVPGRPAGRPARRHRDDRRVGRAARRPRPHRGGQRGAASTSTGTRSRCPSTMQTRRPRLASTRTRGSSPAATTTRWSPRSPPGSPLPEQWRVIGRVTDGSGVTVNGEPTGPARAGSTSAEQHACARSYPCPTWTTSRSARCATTRRWRRRWWRPRWPIWASGTAARVTRRRWRRPSSTRRDGVFLVAYADGVPAGCGGWRSHGDDGETAEIKRMYVAPEARRRGIARRLLAALEDSARRPAGAGSSWRRGTSSRRPSSCTRRPGTSGSRTSASTGTRRTASHLGRDSEECGIFRGKCR